MSWICAIQIYFFGSYGFLMNYTGEREKKFPLPQFEIFILHTFKGQTFEISPFSNFDEI